MTGIRIKDGDRRVYTDCTAITIELEGEYRVIAWTGNIAIHIGNLHPGAAVKILEGENK